MVLVVEVVVVMVAGRRPLAPELLWPGLLFWVAQAIYILHPTYI